MLLALQVLLVLAGLAVFTVGLVFIYWPLACLFAGGCLVVGGFTLDDGQPAPGARR